MITLIVKLDVEKPMPELTDLVAGRIYTLEGIDVSKDVTVRLLHDDLAEVVEKAWKYDSLNK